MIKGGEKMDIMTFIVEEGLIMIPVLYILGEIIKKTDILENKWIPFVLLLISIALTPLLLSGYTPDNVVQAILVTGASVLANELKKQAKEI